MDMTTNDQLQKAMEKRDFAAIARLVAVGGDPNLTLGHRSTLLHLAVEGDQPNLVQALVGAGARIDGIDNFGHTPLGLAVRRCNPAICQMLVDAGAKLRPSDDESEAPLHPCAYTPDMIPVLIAAGRDVNAPDRSGLTPLFYTIGWGFDEAVRLLIQAGARADVRDARGVPVLHFTVLHGSAAACELLLDAGADLHAVGLHGETALYLAAACGKMETVSLLIKRGARTDAPDEEGYFPLQATNDDATFLALLNASADPHLGSASGRVPFHMAIARDFKQSVAACLERPDTDVTQKTSDGRSLMDLAIASQNPEMRDLIAAALAKAQLAAAMTPTPQP